MAKAKEFNLDNPPPIRQDEDQETLAAIDEGIRDADADRTTPVAKVRKLLSQWTTVSSLRKDR
jgi:hypothetical protein